MKGRTVSLVAISLLLLIAICMAGSTQAAMTATQAKEATQLDSHASMTENLLAMKGKTVTVTFAGGQLTGIVKDATTGFLHLERLSQKEFYDAIIRIDSIIAVEARVR